jgi:hypothetical protein
VPSKEKPVPIKFGRLNKLLTAGLALAIVGVVLVVNQAPPRGHTTTLSTRLASATRVAEINNGSGYWLVGSDGGVFTYGDAQFYGSMAGKQLNSPITGIVATADGKGYWLVAKDGGIFAFGDATFQGSAGNSALAAPVVGMASSTAASAAGPVGSTGPAGATGATGPEGPAGPPDSTVAANLNTEVTRAEAAESALNNAITGLQGSDTSASLTAIQTDVTTLLGITATAGNLSTAQTTLNTISTNVGTSGTSLQSVVSQLQTTVNSLNTTVSTLNTKLDTLCAKDGASC